MDHTQVGVGSAEGKMSGLDLPTSFRSASRTAAMAWPEWNPYSQRGWKPPYLPSKHPLKTITFALTQVVNGRLPILSRGDLPGL